MGIESYIKFSRFTIIIETTSGQRMEKETNEIDLLFPRLDEPVTKLLDFGRRRHYSTVD